MASALNNLTDQYRSMVGDTAAAGVIRVLLVEEDQHYRDTLENTLPEHGFAVTSFSDGEALLDSPGAVGNVDIIVLGWDLPKISGIDLLPQLRQHGITLPIVLLSLRASTAYETLAFDRGAIDFVDKVRGVDILARRLRRIVRPAKPAPVRDADTDEQLVYSKLVLRPTISRAFWEGKDVGLTLGEYNIVHYLASNIGRHLTYRAIYDHLHYKGFVAGHGANGYRANVRSAIRRIRKKFRSCDPTFAEIKNFTALGYCWS